MSPSRAIHSHGTSHRLQVLVSDDDLAALRRAAAQEGVTVSEWVRRSVREASRRGPEVRRERLLAAIDRAYQYSFAAPDIEQMLEETERGYLDNGYVE